MRISKQKAARHYVDLILKVFEKNPEITQGSGRWSGGA